jgi:hypothetical protein
VKNCLVRDFDEPGALFSGAENVDAGLETGTADNAGAACRQNADEFAGRVVQAELILRVEGSGAVN